MRGARQCCGHNPGYLWEDGQDQTGVEISSAAKPKNARILNFSRERQKILKLWYADFFYKRPGSKYFWTEAVDEVSAANTQLCHCGVKASIGNIYMEGHD